MIVTPSVRELEEMFLGPRPAAKPARRFYVHSDDGTSGPFTRSSAELVAGVRATLHTNPTISEEKS